MTHAQTVEFELLYESANRACEQGESTADFEPELAGLLDLLVRNPVLREPAETRFIESIRRGAYCWEVAAYCMHELGWDSVREEVAALAGHMTDPRARAPLLHILAAFEADWPDAEMFKRF